MGNTKKERLCAYCGIRIADAVGGHTREHVIPRSLFPQYPGYQPRTNLLTVDACAACNGGKAMDDAYLRDVLAVRLAALRHPDIRYLVENFAGAAVRGRSLLARTIATSSRVARHPGTGLILPHQIEVPLEDARLARILKNIVRALYFKEHKRVLNSTYQYIITEIPEEAPTPDSMVNQWMNMILELGVRPYREVGDGQFEYQHARFKGDPDTTLWTLCFFGGIFYAGFTLPPNVSSLSEMAHVLFRGAEEFASQQSSEEVA